MKHNCLIDLAGRVALITGGSRGIGAATAVLMARAGADIIIIYRRERKSCHEVRRKVMQAGGRFLGLKADVSNRTAVKGAVSTTLKHFGRIDILPPDVQR